MFEAKYNLWKLDNKVCPSLLLFFSKGKKQHFLKIDIATNMSDFVSSSPVEIKT